jgi:hypothetical protein
LPFHAHLCFYGMILALVELERPYVSIDPRCSEFHQFFGPDEHAHRLAVVCRLTRPPVVTGGRVKRDRMQV